MKRLLSVLFSAPLMLLLTLGTLTLGCDHDEHHHHHDEHGYYYGHGHDDGHGHYYGETEHY